MNTIILCSLTMLLVIIYIRMSKKSRNKHRHSQNRNADKAKNTLMNYIQMVPSVCQGKTLEQIICDFCRMFNQDNQLKYYKSLYTTEELKSIIKL